MRPTAWRTRELNSKTARSWQALIGKSAANQAGPSAQVVYVSIQTPCVLTGQLWLMDWHDSERRIAHRNSTLTYTPPSLPFHVALRAGLLSPVSYLYSSIVIDTISGRPAAGLRPWRGREFVGHQSTLAGPARQSIAESSTSS